MSYIVQTLRNNLPVILIVPMVVIVMTWPTFPHIFDADEFWLHTAHRDKWLNFWNAWHVEGALTGQSTYFYSDMIFHPTGLPLAFKHVVLPHALLTIVLQQLMPADDAYNLLLLLLLCFNAFCTYALIQHLINNKWISLFGALVVGVNPYLLYQSTSPDLILIGTLPLAVYFLHRAVEENRMRFAALTGFCLGASAFISMYIFGISLLTAGFYAACLSISRWTQARFWRQIVLSVGICVLISAVRIYPMVADRALLKEGLASYGDELQSYDLLDYFVHTHSPFTGDLFDSLFKIAPHEDQKSGYLGYLCLFLLGGAMLHKPYRRRLLPWLAIMVFFLFMRLGNHLTFNGVEYPDVVLPEFILSDRLPALFGAVGLKEYYQPGVILPLAVLSSFGFATLLKSKPPRVQLPVLLLAAFVLAIEFYTPVTGHYLEKDKTEFISWFKTEPNDTIKLINLPRGVGNPHYYLYVQTLTRYPQAYGFSSRNPRTASRYINGNLLLHNWESNRSVHCLPHNEPSFTAALDQLLADGFSHIVVHNWLYGDQFIIHTFDNIPAAYDDGYVSIYRVRDLRLSCQNQAAELPRFFQFARSPSAIPGARSAILSLHPSQPVDPDRFDYLASLFSDWASLVHLYRDDGELATQNAGVQYADLEAFINDNQVIHVLYNTGDTDPDLLISQATFDEFNLCQREKHDDGAVIEHYISLEFSCELVASANPFQVQYDNGARLENLEVNADQDVLDLQFMWSSLHDETHSVSVQLFDAAGAKVLGQDSVIGHVTLDRHRIDIADLDPGNYKIKLIVYNYVTGRTVAGSQTATGLRFDRELTIADLNHN